MSKSTISELADFGQSVWLDYISRPLLESGDLKKWIEKGLRGLTSNPSIFNQAIGNSHDYDEAITRLKGENKSLQEIYDALTVKDIREAADQMKDVYEATKGLDGYVSLEINPLLANEREAQIEEGKRLFEIVGRPNVMIKVPATEAGYACVEELIASGINVNTTLIFSLGQYVSTVYAYLRGLQRLATAKGDLSQVRSVASVFVSRIDSAVDAQLDELLANEKDEEATRQIEALKGKAAVANCRIIFEKFQELFNHEEFQVLSQKGAHLQRVLWGSTSTKNPAYSDIKYVSELITHPTVNTIPEKTLLAFVDHGQVKEAFTYDVAAAQEVMDRLRERGIDIDHVCSDLLHDGLVAFSDAFEALMTALEKKAAQLAV